jgi:hypothetical protein
MGAQLRWDPGDSAGERTLTGAAGIVRFNGWTPDPHDVGEDAIAVGDGKGYKWSHRTDYIASFELSTIADEALAQEFVLWANSFGVFSIDTADAQANTYDECQIAPGTRAVLSRPDRETLDYTLTVTALNIAATPVPLRCVYT